MMKFYTKKEDVKCFKRCEIEENTDLPKCAVKMIYGKVENPHTTIIATCDRQTWRKHG